MLDCYEFDEGELCVEYLFVLFDELGWVGYVGCEYWLWVGILVGLGWLCLC